MENINTHTKFLELSMRKSLIRMAVVILSILVAAVVVSIVTRCLPSPLSMAWSIVLDILFIIIAGVLIFREIRKMYNTAINNDKQLSVLEDHSHIVDNAGLGIWHMYLKEGQPGRMSANPKMLEIMGVENPDISMEDIYSFWHDRIVQSALPSVQKSVQEMVDGKFSENTYQWNHPTKGIIYNRCGGTSEKLPDGTCLLSGYHYDVTSIVGADIEKQKVLAEALENAEHSSRAKSVFLNNMSHDIRTPMNAIVGFTALAYSHIDDRDLVRDYLTKISTASQHLLSLINDVLDMSRIESGKVTITEKGVHLPDIIHDIQTITQTDIEAKKLNFSVDIANIRHEYVMADKLRLNQVILNIISNSIKYTHEGGSISLTVNERKCKKIDNAIFEFIVKDNGIGMSPEFKKHIFEPFTREKSSTVSGIPGTGLGLAITKNIVNMMGGTIQVSSEPGKGSQFIVTLQFKVVLDEVRSKTVKPKENELDIKPQKISRLTNILLVEDNELNREIAQTLLEEDGYHVDVASDGSIAVEIIKASLEGRYDLILMDIQMPKMNGYDATRAIRAIPNAKISNIPIIAMTANAFAEDIAMATQAGMNAHLAKPIEINALRATIKKVLGIS